jgi:2-polyprenyl-6-hydroxyphenyl methylase/3-demethylubiquinone-9 3-methyltransferase
MSNYYSNKLSAVRLKLCYDLAPPRVKQYLKAEINLVLEKLKPDDLVLELGCGYGRGLKELYKIKINLFGIDVSAASLHFAEKNYLFLNSCFLLKMDALDLGFHNSTFDLVFCIQNGISAFGVDPKHLINESMRVTRSGGRVLFSSYSEAFWEARLEWFQIQSEHGLVGDIDYRQTGNGIIVCKDGFRATTFSPADFYYLTSNLNKEVKIFEVDNSSIFCEIII